MAQPRSTTTITTLLAVAVIMVAANMLAANAAVAQEFPRLGLSAAPDRYESIIETEAGSPFTLYIIATGSDDREKLPFDLKSVDWVVYSACCGDSPVLITEIVLPQNTTAEGNPYFGMRTTAAADCIAEPTVLLATLVFDWIPATRASFPLAAGAIVPAVDCEGDEHVLAGLNVQVLVKGGSLVPNGDPTWGRLKSYFR